MLLKSQLGVAGKPLDDEVPETEAGLEVVDAEGAEARVSTW